MGDLTVEANLEMAAEALENAMGPHAAFLRGMETCHRNGNLFFTHAGANPDLPPDDQDEGALIWGTDTFYRKPRRDGMWVVHGHDVVPEAAMADSRISIDTGAYLTGTLTALYVNGTDAGFLQETAR